jgi:NAD(P)-dependent dehydrogenase (short-subunit alcohol dehydrogenase family)
MQQMGSLDNKNVVVIGATSGIGLATASLAVEEGANVWGVSRSEDKVAAAAAEVPGARFSTCDTHDIAGLTTVFESVGSVDHIVGNATGADRTIAPFIEQTDEQFREAFNKFWGYCNVVRCGVPFLTANGSITLVSGFPARKCNPGMSSISCVGNAVEGLTRALALELAPRRVNAVAPGSIETAMFANMAGEQREERLAQMGKRIPLGRVGQPSEVAASIIHTMVNTYMTGATLDVDGGALLP